MEKTAEEIAIECNRCGYPNWVSNDKFTDRIKELEDEKNEAMRYALTKDVHINKLNIHCTGIEKENTELQTSLSKAKAENEELHACILDYVGTDYSTIKNYKQP